AVTVSEPGTVTVGGTDTVAGGLPGCTSAATDHVSAPPPASVNVTVRVPPLTGNASDDGAAKKSGLSAFARSIIPPPSRVVGTSDAPLRIGAPVVTSADLICAGVHVGWRCFRSAAPPATCGAAMLVPFSTPN